MQAQKKTLILGAVLMVHALLLFCSMCGTITAVSAHSAPGGAASAMVAFPPAGSVLSRRARPLCEFASCGDFKSKCVRCLAKTDIGGGCYAVTISMTGPAECPKTDTYSWASCCRDTATCQGIKCSLTASNYVLTCEQLGIVIYKACPNAAGEFTFEVHDGQLFGEVHPADVCGGGDGGRCVANGNSESAVCDITIDLNVDCLDTQPPVECDPQDQPGSCYVCDAELTGGDWVPDDSYCLRNHADEYSCTNEVCSTTTYQCTHVANHDICDDFVDCTTDECAGPGGASGTGCRNTPDNAECEDGIHCTVNVCDPDNSNADAATGCLSTANDAYCAAYESDDFHCTNEVCDPDGSRVLGVNIEGRTNTGSGCVHEKKNSNCHDPVACTDDLCDPFHSEDESGCYFPANSGYCEANPGDSYSCSDETCHPENGCQTTRNNDNCPDQCPCTTDTCAADPLVSGMGSDGCTHETKNDKCDDSWGCTDDVCTGVTNNCCIYNRPVPCTQGCTPGYWRNHINRWSLPGTLKASSAFVEAFDLGSNTWQTLFIDGKNGPKNVKMWEAVDNPNKYGPFPFHAVAALLNAIGGNNIPAGSTGLVRYPLDAVTVINKVKAAVTETCVGKNSKDLCFEPVKNELAAYNELGCPLGGSRAFTSVN